MSLPLVSVITPVFNGERFLAEALESVRAQEYPELEVLVIDDGSTDGSAALAARLRPEHPGLRLLRRPDNHGPAAARNAGLAAARGALVTFLDADDLMSPGRLRFQVDYLTAHEKVEVVVGTETIHVGAGQEVPATLRQRPRSRPRYYQMSMMARASVFERVGPFDESFRVSSDTEWMYRAAAAGVRTALVDRALLIRRIHGANITCRTEEIRSATERALLKSARTRIRPTDGSRAGSDAS